MRRTILASIAAGLLLAAATPGAFAFGRGGFHGGPPMMMGDGPAGLPLPILLSVMTPDQRAQLRDVMHADRPAMRSVLEQLKTANDALADRVFTPGTLTAADLDAQVKTIAGLRDQLVQHALATTLKVRALLTPDQLAAAAAKKDKLRDLHDQIRSLMGPPPGPEGDPTE